jgi:transcriptional regulator with XRE-family HTH domain
MKPAARFGTVVGQVVAARRKRLGMTQGNVASEIGVPQSSLSRLEGGSVHFNVSQLRRAARTFKTEASDLLLEAEAGASALAAKGIKVLDEEPRDDEKQSWVWVAPKEVAKVVAHVSVRAAPTPDRWNTMAKKKEERVPLYSGRR